MPAMPFKLQLIRSQNQLRIPIGNIKEGHTVCKHLLEPDPYTKFRCQCGVKVSLPQYNQHQESCTEQQKLVEEAVAKQVVKPEEVKK